MKYKQSQNKIRKIFDSWFEQRNQIDEKINEITRYFRKGNELQQIHTLHESEWEAVAPTSASALTTQKIYDLLPEKVSYEKEIDFEMPEYLLPFVNVLAMTKPTDHPNEETRTFTPALTYTTPGDDDFIKAYADGLLVFEGAAQLRPITGATSYYEWGAYSWDNLEKGTYTKYAWAVTIVKGSYTYVGTCILNTKDQDPVIIRGSRNGIPGIWSVNRPFDSETYVHVGYYALWTPGSDYIISWTKHSPYEWDSWQLSPYNITNNAYGSMGLTTLNFIRNYDPNPVPIENTLEPEESETSYPVFFKISKETEEDKYRVIMKGQLRKLAPATEISDPRQVAVYDDVYPWSPTLGWTDPTLNHTAKNDYKYGTKLADIQLKYILSIKNPLYYDELQKFQT